MMQFMEAGDCQGNTRLFGYIAVQQEAEKMGQNIIPIHT